MIATEPIAPTGTQRCSYFWDGVDSTGQPIGGLAVDEACPVYPPLCAEAVALRELRAELGVTLGAAARALGLTVADASGLERGRVRPAAPSTWAEVLDQVRTLAPLEVP